MFDNNIIGKIRAQSQHMEKNGELTPDILEIIYHHRLFKLFVPDELGGRMTPLPEALRIFEEASWIDGSFGWLVTIGSGGGYFAAFIDPSVCQEVFGPEKAVIAGSGYPSGIAKKVENGYRVSGQWKYCSGSLHATVFTANCLVQDESHTDKKEIRSFIFWPEQVEIVKDWNAFGLKATASHSIKVEDVFVPDERVFDISKTKDLYDAPIYRYPFMQFAETSFTAVCLGIARHFFDEARLMAHRYREDWEASNRFSFVMKKIDEMEQIATKARREFYQLVDQLWEMHTKNQVESSGIFDQLSQTCKETASTMRQCAQKLFHFLGITAVMEDTPINQIWRDLQTVCQHVMLVPFGDEY